MALCGSPGTVDPVAVDLSGAGAFHVGMENVVRPGGQWYNGGRRARVRRIEEAQLRGLGVLGKEREVHAMRVRGGAERIGLAAGDFGGHPELRGNFASYPIRRSPPVDRNSQSRRNGSRLFA